jgi:hypothetical protein
VGVDEQRDIQFSHAYRAGLQRRSWSGVLPHFQRCRRYDLLVTAAVLFICVICQLHIFTNPLDRHHQGAKSKRPTSLLALSCAFWCQLPGSMSNWRMKVTLYSIMGKGHSTVLFFQAGKHVIEAPCTAMWDLHICGMAKDGPGWVWIYRTTQALAINHAVGSMIIWIQREFRGVR